MFIDYLTIMLINLVAGLFLLGYYVYRGIDDPDQRRWAPGFLIVGIIGIATGLHMTLTWPLPGANNIAFGETELLFGVLFLAASLALAFNWSLFSISVFAIFAGFVAIEVGARIIQKGLTQEPIVAGVGFILTGLTGLLLAPVLYWLKARPYRLIFAIIAIIAAAIWAFIGYGAYWSHFDSFAQWAPATLRK
ncbi:MAG: DUF981 domain-containing protein [Firmicutes bacterium]|nr:DUF981 domain-containing protein [Bacillota bacterium]